MVKYFEIDGRVYEECPNADKNVRTRRGDWRGHYGRSVTDRGVKLSCIECGTEIVYAGYYKDDPQEFPRFHESSPIIQEEQNVLDLLSSL